MLKLAAYSLATVSTLAASMAGVALVNAINGGYSDATKLTCLGGLVIGCICCVMSLFAADEIH